MGRLVVTNWVSVDGVAQAPGLPDEDREGGFAYGGWAPPFFDEVMAGHLTSQLGRAETMVFGRRTYETFAAYWPHVPADAPDAAVAAILNGIRKFVASTTLEAPLAWRNTTLLRGDAVDEVARLKAGHGEVQITGSTRLVHTFLQHDLVDEYVLWVFPLLLGAGKRLFTDATPPTRLQLVDTTTSTTGVTIGTYRRVDRLVPAD